MEDKSQLLSVKTLFDTAQSFIVALPPDPTDDMLSAALGLHLSLSASGKKSQIGCGSPLSPDSQLQGLEQIRDNIGQRNLVISFDYHEDDLDKVDYDIRPDGKFYLMVKPKANAPVPDISQVHYSHSGAEADLAITLGINSLEELGKIYANEKKYLDSAQILSLDISPRPAQFTKNFFHSPRTSFSELITIVLEKTNLKTTTEATSNLISTIYSETKDLTSPKVTADTFSSIAFLMRHGAHLPHQQPPLRGYPQPTFFEPLSSTTQEEDGIPLPPEESYSSIPSTTDPNSPIPKDWTKPKIFRASDL